MGNRLDKIIALAKRRGFVFPGSEIYGGLAGTWDLGHLGSELAHNIKELWWEHFVKSREDMYALTSSVLVPEKVWEASGHLEGFADPLVECKKCKKRFRADELSLRRPTSKSETSDVLTCPECGGMLSEPKQFNLMFKFGDAYLRPEIAQGMFVNFKNILDTMRPALPFGIAQIGRAFRNEIAPRDFLFRVREFDLMEFEYFVKEAEWQKHFESWRGEMWAWIEKIGIDKNKVSELEVPDGERAHYSKRTIDFEFEYPFGKKELYGLAYRGDYDLSRHMERSGADLRYADPGRGAGEKFIPHVIEPTFGLGRTILAVLLSSYREEGDRVVLALPPKIAPTKVAVFPLVSNKENLVKKAREVYENLKRSMFHVSGFAIDWDDRGNIGKRYYAQDEIGTPWCVTIDYQTLEDNAVTVRFRDTGKQERRKIFELNNHFAKALQT